jgi:putative FmdB family regulatory protein
MPLYEFICRDCDHEQELLVRGEDVPKCESCGGEKLTKLLSTTIAHSSGSTSQGSLPSGGGGCGSGCACHGS